MRVRISSDAEADIAQGYRFYEYQANGLGEYFRDSILADIESLNFLGGIHSTQYGYQRMLAKTFPFTIYYTFDNDTLTVTAVLDARQDPSWIRNRLS